MRRLLDRLATSLAPAPDDDTPRRGRARRHGARGRPPLLAAGAHLPQAVPRGRRARRAAARRRGRRDLDLQAHRRRRARRRVARPARRLRAGHARPRAARRAAVLRRRVRRHLGRRALHARAARRACSPTCSALEPDALDRRRHGDVLARITGDVHAIETLLLSAVAELVQAAARILFFAGRAVPALLEARARLADRRARSSTSPRAASPGWPAAPRASAAAAAAR